MFTTVSTNSKRCGSVNITSTTDKIVSPAKNEDSHIDIIEQMSYLGMMIRTVLRVAELQDTNDERQKGRRNA